MLGLHLEFNFKSMLWHRGGAFTFHAGDWSSRPGGQIYVVKTCTDTCSTAKSSATAMSVTGPQR